MRLKRFCKRETIEIASDRPNGAREMLRKRDGEIMKRKERKRAKIVE